MRPFTRSITRPLRPTVGTAVLSILLLGVGLTFGGWLAQFAPWRPGLVALLTSAALAAALSRTAPTFARAAALGVTAGVAAGVVGVIAGVWPPIP